MDFPNKPAITRITRTVALLLVVSLLSVILSGCVDAKAQQEIIDYINVTLADLAVEETAMTSSYGGAVGSNFKSDAITYDEITKTALPAAQRLVQKASTISPENEDLRAVHRTYVKYAESYMNGIICMISAYDTGDSSKVADANAYISQSTDYALDFKKQLEDVAKKYNVTFTWNN